MALTVDSVCTRIMGFRPEDIKHLQYASQHGLGQMALEHIRLLGEKLEDVQREFESPFDAMQGGRYEGINIFSQDACSDCIGGLMVALKRIDEDGTMKLLRDMYGTVNISVGKHGSIPEHNDKVGGWICIGKCQRAHKNGDVYVPGCPPPGFLIRDVLRTIVGLEGLFEPEEFIEQERHILEVERRERQLETSNAR
jgi:hypothetical protein